MDVLLALVGVFTLLMLGVYKGIEIIYPLFVGLLVFIFIAYKRGFGIKQLTAMIVKGARKSLTIINILLLIGAITAVWRASGTVAYVVYYGIKLMNPNYFILYAFILCSMVSFLLGTSFGTVGTIGMILMVMVKGGDININMVAGAIIAGAYFGDRCSPMSSSANLVATVTDTDLYKNIKNMFRTSILPFVASIILYGILSFKNPLYLGESGISAELMNSFNLNWLVILPAAVILIMSALRVEVKLSMLISIICGIAVALFVQKEAFHDVIRYIILGYSRPEEGLLGSIISGGGVASMLKVTLVILVSFALSGVFEGTALLKEVEKQIFRLGGKLGVYAAIILTSVMAASFGCSQTLAIMLTYQLIHRLYEARDIDKHELALDIENTVIVISALIPWNIAGAVPAAALTADSGYAAYAFYLYLLPLMNLAVKYLKQYRVFKNIG